MRKQFEGSDFVIGGLTLDSECFVWWFVTGIW